MLNKLSVYDFFSILVPGILFVSGIFLLQPCCGYLPACSGQSTWLCTASFCSQSASVPHAENLEDATKERVDLKSFNISIIFLTLSYISGLILHGLGKLALPPVTKDIEQSLRDEFRDSYRWTFGEEAKFCDKGSNPLICHFAWAIDVAVFEILVFYQICPRNRTLVALLVFARNSTLVAFLALIFILIITVICFFKPGDSNEQRNSRDIYFQRCYRFVQLRSEIPNTYDTSFTMFRTLTVTFWILFVEAAIDAPQYWNSTNPGNLLVAAFLPLIAAAFICYSRTCNRSRDFEDSVYDLFLAIVQSKRQGNF